jgi:hypothetical protein
MAAHYTFENTYGDPSTFSYRFRAARACRVQSLVEEVIARTGRCRILDVGGAESYWNHLQTFVAHAPIEIHLLNLEPTAVSGKKFVSIVGDAVALDYLDDNSYDFVHSNSVIEHVGAWSRMVRIAQHVRRLAPVYYVQTPYFWFPYEPHFRIAFFHWLPEQIRYRLAMRFNLGFFERQKTVEDAIFTVRSCNMLDRHQLRELFPDAYIIPERALGLIKSLMAIRS